MKKSLIVRVLLVLSALFYYSNINAQSAVAFCAETSIYAYYSGAESESMARLLASKKCRDNGGRNPSIIISSGNKGYGCIYSGEDEDGKLYISAYIACSSASEADRNAKNGLNQNVEEIRKLCEFYDPFPQSSGSSSNTSNSVQPYEPKWVLTNEEEACYSDLRKGDYEALRIHTSAALNRRETHEIWMLRGYAYMKLDKFQDAWTVYDYIITEGRSDDPLAYLNRGNLAIRLNKFNSALQDFNSAISKGYSDKGIYKSIGYAYFLQKNYTSALQNYETYIQSNTTDPEIYALRGQLYSERNEILKAKADYTKAIELGSNSSNVYLGRGKILINQKSMIDAEKDFTKMTEINPNDYIGWHFLGYTAGFNGNMQKSLEALNKCISLNPDFAEAYLCRSETYRLMKNQTAAIADYNKAIQIDPKLKKTP